MKKSKLMVITVIVMMLSLVLGITASAGCEPPCPPPEPPPCDLGCTPGYWKQEHHFGNWVDYSPDDIFHDVFGSGPEITLLEALKARGPGSELLRHSVAALLNEMKFGDGYPADGGIPDGFIVDPEVHSVLWAYVNGYADLMVESNEAYCPLGRAE